jgi:DNA-binding NarL/FixJ family response regulator
VKKIRVGLADDHRIVLEGLAQLLASESDMEVVFQSSSGEEALAAAAASKPDVLVADVRMPGLDGIGLLKKLRSGGASPAVVLLTAHVTDAQLLEAVRFGVGGVVLKEAATRTLVGCVRAVARGEGWLDQKSMQGALDSILRREAGLVRVNEVLTRRELEIVRMAASGLRNREIAERLSITEGTVKIHLHSIYEKLKISGRMELSIYAREHDLL